MKKAVAIFVGVGIIASLATAAYASDWDKFGKAMAAIEGIRILTGGNVDILGTITGVKDNNEYSRRSEFHWSKPCHREHHCAFDRLWVAPKIVWKKEYIPEHEEYNEEYGTIIVEGHYIRYKVEEKGHWKPGCRHHKRRHHSRLWYD